ncbi:MAG: sulfur carrier protein ThiS [Phycisphaerales bacterium]
MRLIINDTPTEAPDGTTVAELLERRNMRDQPCAVEVNRALVPKRRHAEHQLADGDRVEIVTLIGGG